MPLFIDEITKIFRNSSPLSDENLDEVIKVFEDFFNEYNENKSNDVTLQLSQLKKIKEANLDKLINEFIDDLKYEFFSYFCEKKENLKLTKKLNNFLIEIDKEIIKQNQELLSLEKNELLTEQNKFKKTNQDNTAVVNIKDHFSFLSFLSETVNNDISFLKDIKLKFFDNKKDFLSELRKLKSEINKENEKLCQKNKKLENQTEKIFEKLFKEEIMTQFILSFWAFRIKNEGHEYKLKLEDKDLKNKPNEDFSFFLDLIDIIFIQYIKKNIQNEEKICDRIFQKLNDQKKYFQNEQEENIKNKEKVAETIEKLQKELDELNQEITKYKKELNKGKNQIENLKKQWKDIKNKKTTYLQDWKANKHNFENQAFTENDLGDKKGKKQYLNRIENEIQKIEKYIKSNDNSIKDLEDNIERYKTELKINNKKIETIEKKINKEEINFEKNKYMMMSKLKKLKEKWINKISINQKKFIVFLKTINKLEDITFIEFFENYWEIAEKNPLVHNDKFNIKNHLQNIKEQNEQTENKWQDMLEKSSTDFKLNEEKIIENATKEMKKISLECLRKINTSKLVTTETQTEINQEGNNGSWQEQKNQEQMETIEKLQIQIEEYEKKLILIKQEHEDETQKSFKTLESIKMIFKKDFISIRSKCDKLKFQLDQKNTIIKEQQIIAELNEEEIKLLHTNTIVDDIIQENPTLERSFFQEAWDNINSNDSNLLHSQASLKTKVLTITT